MLDSLCGVLKADVDSDLLNSSHTNALLLRQLFQQAEKWHLKLQANIAEIEDKSVIHLQYYIVRAFFNRYIVDSSWTPIWYWI